jgi:hypothetical protein
VSNSEEDEKYTAADRKSGFFDMLIGGLVSDGIKFILAFLIGTGVSAAVCIYYSIPLVFSVVGGVLVMGITVALMSNKR